MFRAIKPVAEVVIKPNRRLCETAKLAGGDANAVVSHVTPLFLPECLKSHLGTHYAAVVQFSVQSKAGIMMGRLYSFIVQSLCKNLDPANLP